MSWGRWRGTFLGHPGDQFLPAGHKKQSFGGVLSKDVLKHFAKFTDKHLCRGLLFNKVAGSKPETVRSSH